ncbi:MAG: hypothetical protein ACI4KF_00205, partial [Huintestinicola sp.]
MKRISSFILAAAIFLMCTINAEAKGTEVKEPCYVLVETTTGTVIRSRCGDRRVCMGSFNKLMTVLLAAEAAERGEVSFDTEFVCSEHANSM